MTRRFGARMAGHTFRGMRARELREQRGLSARAAAAELGVTGGHLSNIERGQFEPSGLLFYRICALYEVEPDELREAVTSPAAGGAAA